MNLHCGKLDESIETLIFFPTLPTSPWKIQVGWDDLHVRYCASSFWWLKNPPPTFGLSSFSSNKNRVFPSPFQHPSVKNFPVLWDHVFLTAFPGRFFHIFSARTLSRTLNTTALARIRIASYNLRPCSRQFLFFVGVKTWGSWGDGDPVIWRWWFGKHICNLLYHFSYVNLVWCIFEMLQDRILQALPGRGQDGCFVSDFWNWRNDGIRRRLKCHLVHCSCIPCSLVKDALSDWNFPTILRSVMHYVQFKLLLSWRGFPVIMDPLESRIIAARTLWKIQTRPEKKVVFHTWHVLGTSYMVN